MTVRIVPSADVDERATVGDGSAVWHLAQVRELNGLAAARGQTLAQMALAWVLRDGRMTSALIGASRVEQVEQNVAALANLEFSADELARIDTILKHAA